MPLKKSTGNMYSWVTHTWNPVKGKCPYGCSYCYVSRICKRFGREQREPYLDERELRANLGSGNTIFVCDSIDLFAPGIPDGWIQKIVVQVCNHTDNTYLWHTKNPARVVALNMTPRQNRILCATIESNVHRPKISIAPEPQERATYLRTWKGRKMITVEPVMDFDVPEFIGLILTCNPEQVNIGADTGHNRLPEPPGWKIGALVDALETHTKVHLKRNLDRIYRRKN